jgi:aspartate racemase
VKRIGLLGGMSWESSSVYYRLVNEMVRERLGGLSSADCLLRSLDFAPIERLQSSGDWDAAGSLAAEVEAAVSIPFVHIADATAAAVSEAGLERVGLLATGYTMEDFYVGRLAR